MLSFPSSMPECNNRAERCKKALECVGLANRMKHKPFELSGGEQQRVAIARAWSMTRPLSWPMSPRGNLDSRRARRLCPFFWELLAQGMTLLLITHDRGVAEYGERICTFQGWHSPARRNNFEGNLPPKREMNWEFLEEKVLMYKSLLILIFTLCLLCLAQALPLQAEEAKRESPSEKQAHP